MYRRSAATVIVGCIVGTAVLAGPPPAGASGLSVKVSPNRGLVNGQTVVITARGLARTAGGKTLTWFAVECTAAVTGRLNPSTDTPHCDVTAAQALKVAHNGSATARFKVTTGIMGDGYCGTPGHATCVIGVGNVSGQGTVVRVTFKVPASPQPVTTTTG
jgi:hypothetical protein